jgi:hypothetical protein
MFIRTRVGECGSQYPVSYLYKSGDHFVVIWPKSTIVVMIVQKAGRVNQQIFGGYRNDECRTLCGRSFLLRENA